jgi:hypothetical protein
VVLLAVSIIALVVVLLGRQIRASVERHAAHYAF